MRIRLAHSPDPDDAFMFYGLARGLVDSGPYRFEPGRVRSADQSRTGR